MATRWNRAREAELGAKCVSRGSQSQQDRHGNVNTKRSEARDESAMFGRWRQTKVADGQESANSHDNRDTSNSAVEETSTTIHSSIPGCVPSDYKCDSLGGTHRDPKSGEFMQGPGISDWGFDFCLDGKEGRHCDPYGPRIDNPSDSLPRRRKSSLVIRQGQGIEEALSKIGAEAGTRQERPRGEGYCPAGELAFRASEPYMFSSTASPGQEKLLISRTPAQRRNQRRVRRRADQRDTTALIEDESCCIVLVRDDCRLHDNPALYHATQTFSSVIPLYVHDTSEPSPMPVCGAGLYWRHMSLSKFEKMVQSCNGRLIIRRGLYIEEILDVLLSSGATAVYFNRQLEPWYHRRDLDLVQKLSNLGFQVKSFKGLVLQREPWEVKTARPPPHLLTKYQGAPTRDNDEWNGMDDSISQPWHVENLVESPLPNVSHFGSDTMFSVESLSLASLGYGLSAGKGSPPSKSMCQYSQSREALICQGALKRDAENDWAFEMRRFWKFGEEGGLAQLEMFLVEAAAGHYQPPERYRADKHWTALLSPYLRFGDLSPRYVYARAREVLPFTLWKPLVRRLFWRDGAYAQLYRWPASTDTSIREQYETEQWSGTEEMLLRWQRGQTGFPLIDAAMRQLWKVGWMPNYLRHVTAQFLIEYLDVSWKHGLRWYDYTLVDSDVAINAMMWQMGGHSGLGAWNFVMHPVFAAKKVDPEGAYVRRWLPELKGLPIEYIHCPWETPCALLLSANVLLSSTYQNRIIEDLVKARKAHARNVIAVRSKFPEMVMADGHEILEVAGQQLVVRVRDDLKDNSEDISLEMTPDDAHSAQRRRLAHTRGIHNEILYDEAKRYEAQYML